MREKKNRKQRGKASASVAAELEKRRGKESGEQEKNYRTRIGGAENKKKEKNRESKTEKGAADNQSKTKKNSGARLEEGRAFRAKPKTRKEPWLKSRTWKRFSSGGNQQKRKGLRPKQKRKKEAEQGGQRLGQNRERARGKEK